MGRNCTRAYWKEMKEENIMMVKDAWFDVLSPNKRSFRSSTISRIEWPLLYIEIMSVIVIEICSRIGHVVMKKAFACGFCGIMLFWLESAHICFGYVYVLQCSGLFTKTNWKVWRVETLIHLGQVVLPVYIVRRWISRSDHWLESYWEKERKTSS